MFRFLLHLPIRPSLSLTTECTNMTKDCVEERLSQNITIYHTCNTGWEANNCISDFFGSFPTLSLGFTSKSLYLHRTLWEYNTLLRSFIHVPTIFFVFWMKTCYSSEEITDKSFR